MKPPDVLMLHPGVTVADIARALRRSGIGVSNSDFPQLFTVSRIPPRFPNADNVIDLAPELPALLKPQAE